MLQRFVDKIFSRPLIFSLVRRLLDDNYRNVEKAIQNELDSRKSTLDIGCGTGNFCKLFSADCYYGIDVSKKYIAYAKRKHPEYKFNIKDATRVNIGKPNAGKFDQVLISGVLHHLPDREIDKILLSVKKLLYDNGKILILEDIHRERFNPIGKLVKKFDVGKHIRTHQEYGKLYRRHFDVIKDYRLSCGIADYSVYLLEPFSFGKKNPREKEKLRKENER